MVLPSGEKIIETKKCRLSGQDFFITDKDLEFYDKISPVFSGKKYAIPSPSLCPDERQRRRLAWRNERILYRRKCDKTGKDILSLYSQEKQYPVYDQKVWWSDEWSALDYGKVFDFSQTFFSQFDELTKVVPLPSTTGKNLENSEYTLHSDHLKNCYMVVSNLSGEELMYGYQGNGSKNCIDFYQTYDSEYCYQVVDINKSYGCYFSQDLDDCRNCFFCYDCQNCSNCLFCFNLRGKSYCINNKQLSAQEYKIEKAKISLENHFPVLQKRFYEMLQRIPHRALHGIKNEDCLGDYLNSCLDCFSCFSYTEGEKLRYTSTGKGSKNSYDCNYAIAEWCLECLSPFPADNVAFSAYPWGSRDSYYLHFCQSSSQCFGSISLKHQKNCILNHPYSTQEYETLCGKIIDHMRSTREWGEFFPHELSPFGYNETVAQEYFPLTEEEVKNMPRFEEWRFREPPSGRGMEIENKNRGILSGINPPSSQSSDTSFKKEVIGRGWNWYDEPLKSFEGNSIVPVPISEYDERIVGYETAQKNIDTLLQGILLCEVTQKPFKIIKQELAFYIENHLPIPTKHPDQRHKERMALRNPRTLFERIWLNRK